MLLGIGQWVEAMNWGSGIFRLWFAGAVLWIAYWAKRYVCIIGDCEGPTDLIVVALGGAASIWIVRGFLKPRPAGDEAPSTPRRPRRQGST